MRIPGVRRSTYADHSMLAMSADKFARKKEVEDLLLTARRYLVIVGYRTDGLPEFVRYNSREDFVVNNALMFNDTRITDIAQDTVKVVFVYKLSVFATVAFFFENLNNSPCLDYNFQLIQ